LIEETKVQLSIIIVNYNSRSLVEQCLASVDKAMVGINTEIIIVDNNSNDGSKEYLPQKFSYVNFIFNDANLGFAKGLQPGI
jgi:GT2 family glycosyltransferase